ncbi:hypothetical protein GGR55DRAFT_310467 [Xylaria sp. FL0064]|nr:hypothetical protein GGR55DRAFT_310467 [Xylaria sp. FL0064]
MKRQRPFQTSTFYCLLKVALCIQLGYKTISLLALYWHSNPEVYKLSDQARAQHGSSSVSPTAIASLPVSTILHLPLLPFPNHKMCTCNAFTYRSCHRWQHCKYQPVSVCLVARAGLRAKCQERIVNGHPDIVRCYPLIEGICEVCYPKKAAAEAEEKKRIEQEEETKRKIAEKERKEQEEKAPAAVTPPACFIASDMFSENELPY